jgi:hypothetical protein
VTNGQVIALLLSLASLALAVWSTYELRRARARIARRQQQQDLFNYETATRIAQNALRIIRQNTSSHGGAVYCSACQQFDGWLLDQLCIGGCGKTFAELRRENTLAGAPLICSPCHAAGLNELPITQRRRAQLYRKAGQVSRDYHARRGTTPPTTPPDQPA